MEPRVSVLLPVFNAEATLGDCLDSLLAQTFKDFEIIAVDDGSYDSSPDILLDYSSKDKRVKMINTEHAGIVAALKAAYNHAKGPYIARMDADDISLPHRFELQVKMLDDRSDIAVAGCQVGPIPGESLDGGYQEYFRWINDLIEPEQIALNMFVESPMPHPAVMFRRGPYEQVGGYRDHRWPEDYGLWLRLHLAGFKFAKVPQTLIYWRDHPGRASRNHPRYDVDAFFQAKAYYLSRGPLNGVEEVIIWGAGKTTRQRAEYLTDYGFTIIAFVDVDPNKIGHRIRGVPVISPDDLDKYPDIVVLPFVRKRGARDDIRKMLTSMGKVEGKDFICCA